MGNDKLFFGILGFVAMIISLTVHEFSHGLMALGLGDDTAKRAGRLTLNPLSHIDLIGTVVLPILGILSGLPLLGWAKPVPYSTYNIKYPRFGGMFIALAGPISNFVMAIISLSVLAILIKVVNLPLENFLIMFLIIFALINISLGFFNLLPLPPLDGSKILSAIFNSPKHQKIFMLLEQRGFWILWGIILLDSWLPFSPLSTTFLFLIRSAFSLFGLAGLV